MNNININKENDNKYDLARKLVQLSRARDVYALDVDIDGNLVDRAAGWRLWERIKDGVGLGDPEKARRTLANRLRHHYGYEDEPLQLGRVDAVSQAVLSERERELLKLVNQERQFQEATGTIALRDEAMQQLGHSLHYEAIDDQIAFNKVWENIRHTPELQPGTLHYAEYLVKRNLLMSHAAEIIDRVVANPTSTAHLTPESLETLVTAHSESKFGPLRYALGVALLKRHDAESHPLALRLLKEAHRSQYPEAVHQLIRAHIADASTPLSEVIPLLQERYAEIQELSDPERPADRTEQSLLLLDQLKTVLRWPRITTPEEQGALLKLYYRLESEVDFAIHEITQARERQAQVAAGKGNAMTKAHDLAAHTLRSGKLLAKTEESMQTVIRAPEFGSLLKQSVETANYQEKTIDAMFSIVFPAAIVPQVALSRLEPLEYGDSLLTTEEQARAIALKANEPPGSAARQLAIATKTPEGLAEYERFQKSAVVVQEPFKGPGGKIVYGEARHRFFSDICSDYYRERLDLDTKVGHATIRKHLSDNTPFGRALKFAGNYGKRSIAGYYIPDLTADQSSNFAKCERTRWEYRDDKDVWHPVTLHRLQTMYIENPDKTWDLVVRDQSAPATEGAIGANDDLLEALSCRWKFISTTVSKSDDERGPETLDDVNAKPFIENMILLSGMRGGQNGILQRLDSDSYVKAILTLDFQFQDLHTSNIGFSPLQTEAFNKWKNVQFRVGALNYKLIDLIAANPPLTSRISMDGGLTFVSLEDDQFSELRSVLDGPWTMHLFDTDINMNDTNGPISVDRRFYLSLRNHLLERPFTRDDIPAAALDRLAEVDAHDDELMAYMNRADAPVRRRLAIKAAESSDDQTVEGRRAAEKAVLAGLDQHLKRFLSKPEYNPSGSPQANVPEFQRQFSKNLANDGSLSIWAYLTKQLGEDLTGKEHPVYLRRKEIALQLFPRITLKQQEAYFERVKNRRAYLDDYRRLTQLKLDPKNPDLAFDWLEALIQKPSTPLSTVERAEYSKTVVQAKAANEFIRIKVILMERLKPSLSNMAKAEYSLFADVDHLATLKKENEFPFAYDREDLLEFTGLKSDATPDMQTLSRAIISKLK